MRTARVQARIHSSRTGSAPAMTRQDGRLRRPPHLWPCLGHYARARVVSLCTRCVRSRRTACAARLSAVQLQINLFNMRIPRMSKFDPSCSTECVWYVSICRSEIDLSVLSSTAVPCRSTAQNSIVKSRVPKLEARNSAQLSQLSLEVKLCSCTCTCMCGTGTVLFFACVPVP